MNILVVNDSSWDNFALVSRRINAKCINPDHRINYFYGKHMQFLTNICNQNTMCLIRRPIIKENLEDIIVDSLKSTKFCIIFHNFIEYNTLSSLIIKLCIKNSIPYFVFSEHCDNFYMNGEYITDKKFKKCVREIEFLEREIKLEIPINLEIFTEKTCPKNIQEILNNLRSRYQNIKDTKDSKRIIYDENALRTKKNLLKSKKEMGYIDYMASKNKWIKETTPRR